MKIREINKSEYLEFGELMVSVYKNLAGFPSPDEQPEYYEMLANIGSLNEQEHTSVFVAVEDNRVLGGVVYYSDMSMYGSGGSATSLKNSSGIRLLGVSSKERGKGVGNKLTDYCIQQAAKIGNKQVILHTTQFMQAAWKMYENMGFIRFSEIDFKQKELDVFGFRLQL
ncbi:MAG: GNAT family N-acetyltransferase [Kangiellaceae bacterium]|nr:GNAT family N-acetyltransferase [Kangiellaceae bacterium]MCW9016168.1 GNAT family N-acetyltransferase [Kangiellaceae bacterium]